MAALPAGSSADADAIAQAVLAPERPDLIHDGVGYWFGPVDVMADATSSRRPATITIGPDCELTSDAARRVAALLTAAADFCEGITANV